MSVDDRVSIVSLIEGESSVRAATVVRRDQATWHVTTDDEAPLPIGKVVGLMTHPSEHTTVTPDGGVARVALAMVAEQVEPNIIALRVLERRS